MNYKEIFPLYEQALSTDAPDEAFVLLMKELLAQGYTRKELEAPLGAFYLVLRDQDREIEGDIVADIGDDLARWTSYPRF
jgi:hypothetical protein